MWHIVFYETAQGKCPVAEFIRDLPEKLQAKALHNIDLLQEFGNRLPLPYSKPMKDGVFELRISQANNAVRIFYFFMLGEQIVMTNGFIKKTQKTPKRELDKALKYKQDFEKRNQK